MVAEKPQRAASVPTLAVPPAPLEPLPEVRESPARSIKRVLTTDMQIEEDEMKQSRKAVKEALRVLEYHDSTVRPLGKAWAEGQHRWQAQPSACYQSVDFLIKIPCRYAHSSMTSSRPRGS